VRVKPGPGLPCGRGGEIIGYGGQRRCKEHLGLIEASKENKDGSDRGRKTSEALVK